MPRKQNSQLKIYLEVGGRRTFAAAVDWPGWCRVGKDEASALQALWEYGPHYARALRPARLGFQAPNKISDLVVVERLKGNVTTNFGAPDMSPTGDDAPVDEAELRRLQALLKACWRALDTAAEAAAGKTLRAGPRGGGRNLGGIVEHVLGAEASYLSALGGKAPTPTTPQALRQTVIKTLAASAAGEIAAYGPRGGKRWLPRYFVRRAAWHVLDHVWEIEDRVS